MKYISILIVALFISCSSDSSDDVQMFNEVITDTTGGDNSGGDTTGDNNSGGDTAGDDNSGGDTTGDDNSGGDNMTSTNLEAQFVSDAHTTTGIVRVNDDMTVLDFQNFMTDNGPKLLVYLSTSVDSTDYVNLGDLKGISGDYSYDIPANTDLTKYKYVVIWCVDFFVSFGHAELM